MRLFLSILGLFAFLSLVIMPVSKPAFAEDAPEVEMVEEEEVDPCADFLGNDVQYQRCETRNEKIERMKAAAEKRKLEREAKKKQRTSGFKKNVEKKKTQMKKKKEEAAKKEKETKEVDEIETEDAENATE